MFPVCLYTPLPRTNVDGLSLNTMLSDQTSQWASRKFFIAPNPIDSHHTTDTPSASILHTLCLLGDVNLVITLVEAVVGTLWTAIVYDCNGNSAQSLIFLRCRHIGYAFQSAVTTTQRHRPRSEGHWQLRASFRSIDSDDTQTFVCNGWIRRIVHVHMFVSVHLLGSR